MPTADPFMDPAPFAGSIDSQMPTYVCPKKKLPPPLITSSPGPSRHDGEASQPSYLTAPHGGIAMPSPHDDAITMPSPDDDAPANTG